MVVILDTDHLTVIQRRAEPAYSSLLDRLSKIPEDSVQTTIISFEEQMRGWLAVIARVRDQSKEVATYQRLAALLRIFNEIPVLDYTDAAARQFEALKRSRLHVGTMDLKIAAIALSKDALLLSANLKDFKKVPALKVEDWTK